MKKRLINYINALKLYYTHYKELGSPGITFYSGMRKGKALVDVTIPGHAQPITLRNNTSDIPMFYHIFFRKEYDINFDEKPGVIVDCGSHIGLSAVFFANRFPGVEIICIEPDKSNFDLLVKNTAAYPNIHCLNLGIWNRSANLKIVDTGIGNWGFMTEEVGYADETTVPAISINDIMLKYKINKIDICKINIEGTEKEVFDSNYQYWMDKTKTVIIELHDHLREGCSESFFKALLNYKFSLSNHGVYTMAHLRLR